MIPVEYKPRRTLTYREQLKLDVDRFMVRFGFLNDKELAKRLYAFVLGKVEGDRRRERRLRKRVGL